MLRLGGYLLLDLQAYIIKPSGLTNQLETHKWWSSQTDTKQSWVYNDMNDTL